jgi:hypothetical protein
MFWFAGLVGMGIESKRIRGWLVNTSRAAIRSPHLSSQESEPPSYSASFNPFPALVIGVTGAAMAAHKQTYLFQARHVSLSCIHEAHDGFYRSKYTLYGETYWLVSLCYDASRTFSSGSDRRVLYCLLVHPPKLWRVSSSHAEG